MELDGRLGSAAERLLVCRPSRSLTSQHPSTYNPAPRPCARWGNFDLHRARLVSVDLFAGCGGLSLGLRSSGFHPVLFTEINQNPARSFLANCAERPVWVRDTLTLVEGGQLSPQARSALAGARIDLVCGGPPCQGFSGIGYRRTHRVARRDIPSNHLYRSMVDFIRLSRPRAFLFENVRGLLFARWDDGGEKGEVWRDVISYFAKRLGDQYVFRWDLVQAKDYGVPQLRPRILMVGLRVDQVKKAERGPRLSRAGTSPAQCQGAVRAGFLPPPLSAPPPSLEEVLGDLIDDSYPCRETVTYPRRAESEYQKRCRPDALAAAGAPLTEQRYPQHSARVRERFNLIRSGKPIPARLATKKFAQRVLTRVWPDSGPNITACSLPDDFVHWAQDRTLTVREWARLQGFPDAYKFFGPRTTGGERRAGNPTEGSWDREVCRYTQIGNAVPVPLAEEVGKHIRRLLEGDATIVLR